MSALSVLVCFTGAEAVFAETRYAGICDASAAVDVGGTHVLVANDETDILSLFRNDNAGAGEPVEAVKRYDLRSVLQVHDDRESDIEGSARIGDRVFWITSHGRNKDGKIRENRYQLFATDLGGAGAETSVSFVGSYIKLAEDMQDPGNWANPHSQETAAVIDALTASLDLGDKKVKALAPKKNGLNIEGLATLPDGSGLLIGLRNPLLDGKAILLPLINADDLVGKSAKKAIFDDPVLLDLEGRGIRSLEYVPALGAYLVIAGPVDDETSFRLFRWSGAKGATIDLVLDFDLPKNVSPEALIAIGDSKRIQIINDEGSRQVNGGDCKEADASKRSFSDLWLQFK